MIGQVIINRGSSVVLRRTLLTAQSRCMLQIPRLSSLTSQSQRLARAMPGLRSAEESKLRTTSAINYMLALVFFFWGLTFWSVPMWRVFCESDQTSWFSAFVGDKTHNVDENKVKSMEPIYDHPLIVKFHGTTDTDLPWDFNPCQDKIITYPGETALAFYEATNKTDYPIVGVSTYNINPYEMGPYFNKIQCFCFEEQILYPGETVEMPVFFFIDPDIEDDPTVFDVHDIILGYQFHKVEKIEDLPALPGFENIKLQKAESLVKL